jgi:hypothetical protein
MLRENNIPATTLIFIQTPTDYDVHKVNKRSNKARNEKN